MANQLLWANSLSTRPSLEAAVAEVVDKVKDSLSEKPDLGIVFISSAYASDYSRLIPLLLEKLSLPVLIGCGGAGIIGMESKNQVKEIEGYPALSLSVARLPQVQITPFYINAEDLPDLDSSPEAWVELIGVSPEKNPQFILLSDPFSSQINDLLEGLDFAYPGSIKIGGLASTGAMGVQSSLFYYNKNHPTKSIYQDGTVGIALSGNLAIETIVAQGCRPIGQPYLIAKGERNVILELSDIDGSDVSPQPSCNKPPLEVLRNLIFSLSEQDRQLAQNSLFVGIARDEFKDKLEQRDFLIRNLIGVDPRLGAIAIGDRVRPGQRIQFHLRDAATSAYDLEILLEDYIQKRTNLAQDIGVLMFSCLGRGEGLYRKPNFDSELFSRYLNDIPISGFFCNGEIGPVAGKTFLHGYTSAFAIFRKP